MGRRGSRLAHGWQCNVCTLLLMCLLLLTQKTRVHERSTHMHARFAGQMHCVPVRRAHKRYIQTMKTAAERMAISNSSASSTNTMRLHSRNSESTRLVSKSGGAAQRFGQVIARTADTSRLVARPRVRGSAGAYRGRSRRLRGHLGALGVAGGLRERLLRKHGRRESGRGSPL